MRTDGLVVVDSHVHYYECFHLGHFLRATRRELCKSAIMANDEGSHHRILVLLDVEDVSCFDMLRCAVLSSNEADWRVQETKEAFSFSMLIPLSGRGVCRVSVVRGYQAATVERLEVLALGTDARLREGVTLEETVRCTIDVGAIPIIPWGLGKWWGARGRMLKDMMQSEMGTSIWLGDTSHRPMGLPQPRAFAVAEARGIPIIPGSDPFPLPSHAGRVGRYGFTLTGVMDSEYPGASLKALLNERDSGLTTFGTRTNLVGSLRNQVKLRVRGRSEGEVAKHRRGV